MSRGGLTVFVYTVLIGATTVVTVTANPAGADEDIPAIQQLHREGEIRSLESIVEGARERFPEARLVEAELMRAGDRLIYEVELIDAGGVVRELFFDARTGEPVAVPSEEEESH